MKNVGKMKVFQDGHMCQPMLALLGHLLAMLAPSGLQLGQLGLILALSWVMLTPFWGHVGADLDFLWFLPFGSQLPQTLAFITFTGVCHMQI